MQHWLHSHSLHNLSDDDLGVLWCSLKTEVRRRDLTAHDKLALALEVEEFRERCNAVVQEIKEQAKRKSASVKGQLTKIKREKNRFKAEAAAARSEMAQLEKTVLELVRLKSALNDPSTVYPHPPLPMIQATKEGNLPAASGIYFVWQQSRCKYVGQSICLRLRARLTTKTARNDKRILAGEWLSWLLFPVTELFYAENYYIGLLRPARNGEGHQRKSAVYEAETDDDGILRRAMPALDLADKRSSE